MLIKLRLAVDRERCHLRTSQRAVLALEVMPEFGKLAKAKSLVVASLPQQETTDCARYNLATQRPEPWISKRYTPSENDRKNVEIQSQCDQTTR